MNDILSCLRTEHMPHIWCPGCGNGIVTGAVIRAINESGIDKDRTVIVSGIGCSSRASGYMNFDTLHTAHGRALPFATGIKVANPDLNVIVISGDGDSAAIGGNHLIHACRRNIDITMVIINNFIYGMTSGQYSPLTPTGSFASTAVYKTEDRPFNLMRLTEGAGATYAARSSVYHATLMKNHILNGIKNKGFSVIEAVSVCPTYFGRKNKMGSGADMILWLKQNCGMLNGNNAGKSIILGEYVNKTDPEYTESLKKINERAGAAHER